MSEVKSVSTKYSDVTTIYRDYGYIEDFIGYNTPNGLYIDASHIPEAKDEYFMITETEGMLLAKELEIQVKVFNLVVKEILNIFISEDEELVLPELKEYYGNNLKEVLSETLEPIRKRIIEKMFIDNDDVSLLDAINVLINPKIIINHLFADEIVTMLSKEANSYDKALVIAKSIDVFPLNIILSIIQELKYLRNLREEKDKSLLCVKEITKLIKNKKTIQFSFLGEDKKYLLNIHDAEYVFQIDGMHIDTKKNGKIFAEAKTMIPIKESYCVKYSLIGSLYYNGKAFWNNPYLPSEF